MCLCISWVYLLLGKLLRVRVSYSVNCANIDICIMNYYVRYYTVISESFCCHFIKVLLCLALEEPEALSIFLRFYLICFLVLRNEISFPLPFLSC